MGGIHALRYADQYPETVAGVVLLDTPPAGFERQRMALLSAEEQGRRRAALEEGRSRAPGIVGRERDGASAERWSFERFPATRPLVEQWLDLSDRGQLVIATGSGHMIHQERPGLVLDVIRMLVAHATQGGS
jgi:pimeloyl-ACP methyl ester carboxylesterase